MFSYLEAGHFFATAFHRASVFFDIQSLRLFHTLLIKLITLDFYWRPFSIEGMLHYGKVSYPEEISLSVRSKPGHVQYKVQREMATDAFNHLPAGAKQN